MHVQRIRELHAGVIRSGYGTVTPDEIGYIQDLIGRHRPQSFIEIGMASGISTGFIASFMDEHGGGRLVSLDHDDTFFGDTTKPNGFLVPEIYRGTRVDVELIKFKTAPDVHSVPGSFDMAFIDANHQHPWPAIDMMCLYPRMSGARIMIHHDLRLFMLQDKVLGIGPKYLFDQFPDSHRERSEANGGNIFSVDLTMPRETFENLLTDLFKLPWSLRSPLSPAYIEKIEGAILRDYSERLLTHFRRCCEIYNRG